MFVRRIILVLTFVCALFGRPVSMPSQMTPHMAQPGTAGQMLAQMSRQNGVAHSVTPSSAGAPLHGGPTPGGWPGSAGGAGARPQFNNQVSQYNQNIEAVFSPAWWFSMFT